MDINDLISFGMTRTEARIYIEISKLGETKIGPIIRRTGLHRGTVYNSIHKLIDKGFLSFIDKDRFRFYKISDKRIFKNIIKGKQKEIEEKAIGIENFFEDLKKLGGREDLQDVQVFYGVNSFKSLFLEILDVCKEENCSYCVQGRGGQVRAVIGPAFYKHVQDLKKKMKIKCRAIMSPETKNWNYSKVLSAEKKISKNRSR